MSIYPFVRGVELQAYTMACDRHCVLRQSRHKNIVALVYVYPFEHHVAFVAALPRHSAVATLIGLKKFQVEEF